MDRGVHLDETAQTLGARRIRLVAGRDRLIERDDASGHVARRAADAPGVADAYDLLARGDLVGVRRLDRGESTGVLQLDQGDVVREVVADHGTDVGGIRGHVAHG